MSALAISQICLRVPDAAKQIPRRLRVTPQTVNNWLDGRTMPSAANLVALMTEFKEVADAVLEMTGAAPVKLTQAQIAAARAALKLLVD